MRRGESCTTRCGHTRHWAVKSNFLAYGGDVDSLSEIGTKTRADHARTGHVQVECGDAVVDDGSTDCANAREGRILSLIVVNVRELQVPQRAQSWLTNLGYP